MKKIMFDDRYGLTKAVIDGRKTMTRRIVPEKLMKEAHDYAHKLHGSGHDLLDYLLEHATYKVREIVAIAQKYDDIMTWQRLYERTLAEDPYFPIECTGGIPGKRNKMFVKAEWMPHRIVITNVRVERLQDISKIDALREGINDYVGYKNRIRYTFDGDEWGYDSPVDAFAELIKKVAGKSIWENNPWVFVYSFKLEE